MEFDDNGIALGKYGHLSIIRYQGMTTSLEGVEEEDLGWYCGITSLLSHTHIYISLWIFEVVDDVWVEN